MTDMAAIACSPVMGGELGGLVLGSDWLLLSVLALVVSTLALALLYMFASFFRHPQLLVWTKFELFQLFGTAVVIAFFGVTLISVCTFDLSFLDQKSPQNPQGRYIPVAPGQTTNMYVIIDNYFTQLETLGYLLYGYIMYISKILIFLSRTTVLSSPLGVGSNENPLETMGQVNSLLFVMLSGFITSFLLLQLQMRILDYLAFACIGYLFPLGIFFRCFEPTRSFGGTLLGLSISLFLFYPIIMVFNDYLINSDIANVKEWQKDALAQANGRVAAAGGTPDASQYSNEIGGIWDPDNAGSYNSFAGRITNAVFSLFRPIMVYFVAAVVLPIINFIVLVEIARGSTAFLGDELDVSNLTRLI
ncbi:MAG: hypothetical protein WC717_02505 [Candidatus Micrarchaeia archaeon]